MRPLSGRGEAPSIDAVAIFQGLVRWRCPSTGIADGLGIGEDNVDRLRLSHVSIQPQVRR
jgi:hypothetical protein